MSTLPLSYLPPIAWFAQVCKGDAVDENPKFERGASNRTVILSANGPLILSIPVHKADLQRFTTMDYSKRWVAEHLMAIRSAYGRAAFWEHYGDEVLGLLSSKYDSLFQLNRSLVEWISTTIEVPLSWSGQIAAEASAMELSSYPQVFADRFPFQPNLSILDLLMNLGPKSKDHLLMESRRLNQPHIPPSH